MTEIAVVDMEAYRELIARYLLVGDARIIRIKLESDFCQTLSKLVVVE